MIIDARTASPVEIEPRAAAVVVIDMWDKHWCLTHERRMAAIVPNLNAALAAARKLGMLAVFAPAETTHFYASHPQRQATLALPAREFPKSAIREFNPPAPPFGGGGCECSHKRPCVYTRPVWTTQHPDIAIEHGDFIINGDDTRELWSICLDRRIDTLLYCGADTNMCIIGRSCGIKQMTRLGLSTIIIGDLALAITGNGYNPDTRLADPLLTPERGDDIVLRHLERYWCPSINSAALVSFCRG